MKMLEEKSTQEIAERIYELSSDMDFEDYKEEKRKEIIELENAIYYIKTIAQNEYNNDFFRTFYNALQKI